MKKYVKIFTILLTVPFMLVGCDNAGGAGDEGDDYVPADHVHNWGSPTYEWSQDNTTCTATRVCIKNNKHTESETVSAVKSVGTEATEEEDGNYVWTASFTNKAFQEQYQYETIPAKMYDVGNRLKMNTNKDRFYYGIYPQSRVTDSSILEKLPSAPTGINGWKRYKGYFYTSLEATPYATGDQKFNDGTVIEKGKTYWFKCEAIYWVLLQKINSDYYCYTDKILDVVKYNKAYSSTDADGYYANQYLGSDAYDWLVSTFYFTAIDNDYVDTSYAHRTKTDNSIDSVRTKSGQNPYTGPNMMDYVKLPSYTELLNYSKRANRYKVGTDYAMARGLEIEKGVNYTGGDYWTRSPEPDDSKWVTCCDEDGYIEDYCARQVDSAGVGVVPAMSLS